MSQFTNNIIPSMLVASESLVFWIFIWFFLAVCLNINDFILEWFCRVYIFIPPLHWGILFNFSVHLCMWTCVHAWRRHSLTGLLSTYSLFMLADCEIMFTQSIGVLYIWWYGHLQTLCDRVQETEEKVAEQRALRRHLLQQLEECCGQYYCS